MLAEEKKTIKDIYKSIKTPDELLNFMNSHINFGFVGSNKKIYDSSDLNASIYGIDLYWNLASPTTVLKYSLGNLYDQVELERDWFIKNGYECKTLYLEFLVNRINSLPVHAYLAYKDNDKWYWFEHYDIANRGIHEYDSLEELITDQMTKHVALAAKFYPLDQATLDLLHIYEYKKPKLGMNSKEFKDFLLHSSEVPIVE